MWHSTICESVLIIYIDLHDSLTPIRDESRCSIGIGTRFAFLSSHGPLVIMRRLELEKSFHFGRPVVHAARVNGSSSSGGSPGSRLGGGGLARG